MNIINKIEPSNWWVGMKNTRLQIMLYGQGIREASVTTQYSGVRITELTKLDSPNYLIVYLDIADAKAGVMQLDITLGKKRQTVKFPLLERAMKGEQRMGFSKADVLYMLMPDRFADGKQAEENQLPN
mgnify:CR=1 FL=1